MAARCCMPPDSSYGYLSSQPVSPTIAMSSRARSALSRIGKPNISAGSSTFWSSRRHLSSKGCWNTMPMSRAGSNGWLGEPICASPLS